MTAALIVLLGITMIVCLWASGAAEHDGVLEDSKDEK